MADCDHYHPAGGHRAAPDPGIRRSLSIALGITLLLLVGEAIGGWIANSLALLADAGHVLTDAAALVLALIAVAVLALMTFLQRRHKEH